MEDIFNENHKNCFNCIEREGKTCSIKEEELTLIAVERNILFFKDAERCGFYESRTPVGI